MKPLRRDTLEQAILIALIALIAIPLLIHAYLGTFARFAADDYCYTVLPPQHDYRYFEYLIRIHNTVHGRFSASAMLFFMEWLDPRQTPAYPLLLIAGMVAGLAAMFFVLLRRMRIRYPLLAALVLAELALVVMLQTVLKGDATIGQTLFWRSGSLVYTPPKILLPLLVALIIAGRRNTLMIGLVGLIAFLAGGFSETYAIMATVLIGALMPVLWLVLDAEQRRRVTPLMIVALAGTLAALGLMMTSITVQSGRIPRPPLISTALSVLQTTFWMIEQGIKASPFAYVLLIVLPVTLIRALRRPDSFRLTPQQQAVMALGLPLALISAVMVCLVPGIIYARGVPARALTLPYFLLIIGAVVWGMLALPHLRFDFEQRYPRLGQAMRRGALALVVAIVVGREIDEAPARIAEAQLQAAEWDARNAAIRAAIARGETRVTVEPIRPMWLTEAVGPDPEFYINSCVAFHYGLEALRTP